jgi:hypothetical protein
MSGNKPNQEKVFVVKTYYFRELAQEYFPASSPQSASQSFRNMIKAYKGLKEKMAEKGFVKNGRVLSPSIVQLIVEHLGEP